VGNAGKLIRYILDDEGKIEAEVICGFMCGFEQMFKF
jgi:hypothetical protein